MADQPGHDIIVIGASLGGVDALARLVAQLPGDLPAAVFVVLHISPESPGVMGHMLDQAGRLRAATAEDHDLIECGRVYVAPPDHHLLVRPGEIRVVRGPQENHVRPAIDPLFRSAAVAYGPRVVAALLTGLLDDGTAGLLAVKSAGGTVVVQDPNDAEFPEMPANALSSMEVDYRVSLAEMGEVLRRLARTPAGPAVPIPQLIVAEDHAMEKMMINPVEEEGVVGEPTLMTCPDCGGPLYALEDPQIPRYRCHLGHAYTERLLMDDQDRNVEKALWAALRALKDRADLLLRMATHARERGRDHTAADYEQESAETYAHADRIQALLQHNAA